METNQEIIRCERCGEILQPERVMWLELSNTDGRYYYCGFPIGHLSQGSFPFGVICAQIQILEQDE